MVVCDGLIGVAVLCLTVRVPSVFAHPSVSATLPMEHRRWPKDRFHRSVSHNSLTVFNRQHSPRQKNDALWHTNNVRLAWNT